jgi:glycine oxidase
MQMLLAALPQPDILIAGAGIIGLALALELNARGAHVLVLERDTALSHASTAAAGMLAKDDPHNPPKLAQLSDLSIVLYPDFLRRVESLSGVAVPWQTNVAIQYLRDDSNIRLEEHSIDPRQLAPALLAAVRASSIDLREHVGDLELADTPEAIYVRDTAGIEYSAAQMVHANGAWFRGQKVIRPRKGQMLRIQLPASFPLTEVHRAEHIYIVPRTTGPQAGSALIGATVEDVGYDTTTHALDLVRLRTTAAEILPQLADESSAPTLEAWAGLRPATVDDLPILGTLPFSPREFIATGHFRNGILLAPATAHAMADLIQGKRPTVDLTAFSPDRFVMR